MSLDSYVKNSWLKEEATSPQEIADQLGIVARCTKDAGVEAISDDLRFYTAFNALPALANTALRACGYRATSQPGHHMRTIETLKYTIQADSRTVRKILALSKMRNIASYDAAGSISHDDLREVLATTEMLHNVVHAWLKATHPDLLKTLRKR
jgi:hypothetical protein